MKNKLILNAIKLALLVVLIMSGSIVSVSSVQGAAFTLAVNNFGDGTSSVDPMQATYSENQVVTITAVPDSGWRFDAWSSTPGLVQGWWDAQWDYRLPVVVDAAGYERNNAPVELDLNFTTLFANVGVVGGVDLDSLRVVEVDENNNVVDSAVPFQFDESDTFDATTNADGTLIFLLSGTTSATASRAYHIYYDLVGKAFSPASVTAQVALTDNVMDEGLSSYQIQNNEATYYFQKQAGGFSSIVDADGNDWLNYSTASGANGEYRGLPNLVYPEGDFHPGATNAVSSIVSQGPLKTTIRSVTDDNNWETVWEFYPDFAQLTVVQTNHNYWFLYEGTPGGELDTGSDIAVRSDGTQTLANSSWTGDLAGDEWVYFGDPNVGRSLFLINHQQDTAVDSYYAMDGVMTVFGFGRSGINSYMNTTPAIFTIGLAGDTAYAVVAPEIDGVLQALDVTQGAVEESANSVISMNDTSLTLSMIRDRVVNVTFAEIVTPTLSVLTSGNGSVTTTPNKTEFAEDEVAQLTAVPDVGWAFAGWSGGLTGNENPVSVIMDSDMNITAQFVEAVDGPVIDVWYGDTQHFGQVGLPQQWINILGNVSDPDGVDTLVYSLNGGSSVTLWVSDGIDERRLRGVGDFNADIDYQDLVEGNNQVTFTATDDLGNQTIKNVTVVYDGGNVWPSPYSIDWSTVSDIQDVAQVVDGKWAIQGNGLRTLDPEYDRLVAIGDIAWTDYEVTVPVTINGFNESGFNDYISGRGAGLGMIFRWTGHTDNPAGGWQPKSGWLPNGAIGWYWWESLTSAQLRIEGNGSIAANTPYGTPPTVGGEYIFKMRVETVENVGGLYRIKVWPSTDTEPVDWMLSAQEGTSDPQNGSFLLVAHHIDATFGDVTVTPLGAVSPPVISNVQVTPGINSATITWNTNKPATSVVAYGETVGYELGTESDNTLKSSHSIVLNGLTPNTAYHYQITSVDGSSNSTSTNDASFSTLVDVNLDITSDDYNSCVLDTSAWSFINPIGDGSYAMSGSQLLLTVPAGVSHDAWNGSNMAPRLMQSATDGDFELEVKFESLVSDGKEMQGIIIEQDDTNYLRFDFYGNGGKVNVFAAQIVSGSPSAIADVAIGVKNAPLFMRVERVGDTWTQLVSTDGINWTSIANFSHSIQVNQVGVFAGNAGDDLPVHTAIVDYFFNMATPISPEDADNHDLTVNVVGSGTVGRLAKQSELACGGDVLITAVPDPGWQFDGWSGDFVGTDNPTLIDIDTEQSITATFDVIPVLTSDDFNSCTIDSDSWTFIDPVGDGSYSLSGTQLLINVPAGTDHNIWNNGNRAPRLMQAVPDEDFEIEVKFESMITSQYQMQGVLVEEDDNNYLRLEYYSDGSQIHILAARIVNGTPTALSNVILPAIIDAPMYLRISRVGDSWTQSSSIDGVNWTLRATFTHSMAVNQMGVFAGNAGGNPAQTAVIDYFFNISAIITPEDANDSLICN